MNNFDGLSQALEPGRTAAFNAMFMDRYLWNLHLGTQRLLSKARAGGAPIDGITISAGIPELEEATELLGRLRAEGFPYVAFKPGTVDQIRQILAITAGICGERDLNREGARGDRAERWRSAPAIRKYGIQLFCQKFRGNI